MKRRIGSASKIRVSVWVVAGILSLFLIQACASIIKGKSQMMTFKSEPEGATVTVNGRVIGKTPITTSLEKDTGKSVTVEKEGYKTQTMELTTTIEGWFWGNILLGGLIGSTTDGISGAVHQYSPNQYMFNLAPVDESVDTSKSDAKMYIVVNYDNILKELNTTKGTYISTLFDLLNVPENNQEDAVKKIKELSESHGDIPTFAEKVVSHFEMK
jgi:hypothetical protein